MRKILFFLAITGLFTVSCSGVELNSPILVIDLDTLDMGSVFTGITYEKEVKIRNAGNKNLKISHVKSTCDCSIPHLKDSVIAPGAHTVFTLSITPNATGKFERSIVIESNDPEVYKVLHVVGEASEN